MNHSILRVTLWHRYFISFIKFQKQGLGKVKRWSKSQHGDLNLAIKALLRCTVSNSKSAPASQVACERSFVGSGVRELMSILYQKATEFLFF